MLVKLAYGRGRLALDVPEDTHVIEPAFTPALPNPLTAVHQALANPIGRPPLSNLIRPTDKVTIVHCDGTRPMPNELLLRAIGDVLDSLGVPDNQVTLLNALGTHRPNTPDELAAIVGTTALQRYRSVQARSVETSNYRFVGRLHSGGDVLLHRAYVDADVRILLGFIEPHFFAGFSGGPKLVVPGVAAQQTVEHVHRVDLIGHPQATWGVLQGNPLWETLYAAACLAPPTFIINVALNRDKAITAVFAGDLAAAHQAGAAYVCDRVMRPAPQQYDIVITTNSGFPLDQNLYQSVKGMSAAARIVKPGGSILMAAECCDGIPNHGLFAKIMQMAGGQPQQLLDMVAQPGFHRTDQWQAQILAQICQQAKVYLYSAGITPGQARSMMLEPVESLPTLLTQLLSEYRQRNGRSASVCVLPEGPQTIPFLQM